MLFYFMTISKNFRLTSFAAITSLALSIITFYVYTLTIYLDYLIISTSRYYFLMNYPFLFWISAIFMVLFLVFVGILIVQVKSGSIFESITNKNASGTRSNRNQDSLESQLMDLQALKEKNLINEEEFISLKKTIITKVNESL